MKKSPEDEIIETLQKVYTKETSVAKAQLKILTLFRAEREVKDAQVERLEDEIHRLKLGQNITYCNHYGEAFIPKSQFKELEAQIKSVFFKTLGWAYADACVALDKNEDYRKFTVPEIIERAKKDLEISALPAQAPQAQCDCSSYHGPAADCRCKCHGAQAPKGEK